MAKQLNVNLAFTADTAAAKQQLQDLQQQLNNLTINSVTSKDFPLTSKLHEAQNAVASLQSALNSAMNVNTGKLDLSKFNQSLNSAGLTVEKLRIQLQQFGPDGSKAFMSLAQSVMQAEVPMRRTNALLTQLGTTLKNTAKWQISSMVLHGFMSSVQTAYKYSQDLNKSLNNIRIVTGHNIEYMEKFAATANRSAKALSASTLDYTNASLIYYQQGLNDEQVKERTETTVKMANVLGESAKDVSSYMTAIWNNFDDGTKSLEYYGDAMAALGAATASSSAEIAQGLEKFVSIGKTVGLTYEYATAALATVVAKTRQSADTVGTAFKTIFSRLQGLQLGETLEDGTDLNKYSEALQVVGVDIKTSNGELKQMDTILDELGSKWQTLAQDEKMALAQTVAGVRQYTQLISLMDNYDDFKDNVSIAMSSSGTLDKQHEIYAQGWEAASKRVKAAAESIYSSLLDDDFFISITNGVGDFINLIDNAIKSIGGFKGVLAGISALLLKTFSTQAAKGLENMVYNMKMMTSYGQQQVKNQKNAFYAEASKISNSGYVSETQQAEVTVLKTQLSLQKELEMNADKLSAEELEKYKYILDQNKAYADQYITLVKNKEAIQDESNALSRTVLREAGTQNFSAVRGNLAQADINVEKSVQAQAKLDQIFQQNAKNAQQLKKEILSLSNSDTVFGDMQIELQRLAGQFDITTEQGAKDFINSIRQLSQSGDLLNIGLAETETILRMVNGEEKISAKTAGEVVTKKYELYKASQLAANGEENYKKKIEMTKQSMAELKAFAKTYAQTLVGVAQGISQLAFSLSSITSIVDTLKNPEMSGWEKFLSIAMSLSMVLPGLTAAFSLFNIEKMKAFAADTLELIAKAGSAIMTWADTTAERINAKVKAKSTVVKEASAGAARDEAKADMAEAAATEASTLAELEYQRVKSQGLMLRGGGLNNKTPLLTAGGRGVVPYSGSGGYPPVDIKGIFGQQQPAGLLGPGGGGGKVAKLLTGKSLLASLGFIIAGIAAAAAGITLMAKAWNKSEEEAKKAEEQAENVRKTTQEVKAEYDSLANTISSYKEARDGIDELTKGTVEFKQAISEANEKALELLDNYKGQLDYEVTADGLIKIDDESLEEAQKQSLQKVANAQSAQMVADQIAREKRFEADAKKLKRDKIKSSAISKDQLEIIGGATATGLVTGGFFGAGSGAGVFSAPGAAIGAGIGAVTGAIGGSIAASQLGGSSEREDDAINAIYEAFKEKGNSIFIKEEFEKILEDNGIAKADEKLAKSLLEEKDSIEDLIYAMDDNTKQTKALNASMINNKYSDLFDEEELTDASGQLIGNLLNDELQDKADSYYESDWKDKAGGYTDKEIQEKYAADMGYTSVKNKGGNKAIYFKEDGSETPLEDEFIRKHYARQAALDDMSDTVTDLVDLLAEIEADLIDQIDNVSNYSDYNKAKDKVTDELKDIPGITQEFIDQWISTFFADSDYYKAEQKIENNENKDEIEKWLSSLSDEELKTFLTLEIDKESTLDELKKELEQQQGYLDRQSLSVKIGGKFELAKLLKDGVYDDTLKEAFADAVFGQSLDEVKDTDEFIDAWNAFLAKSRDEQLDEYGDTSINENDVWQDAGNESSYQADRDAALLEAQEKYDSGYYGAKNQQDLQNYAKLLYDDWQKKLLDYENTSKWAPDPTNPGGFVPNTKRYIKQTQEAQAYLNYQDFLKKHNIKEDDILGIDTYFDSLYNNDFITKKSGPEARPNDDNFETDEFNEDKLTEAKAADLDTHRKNFANLLESSDLDSDSVYQLSDAYEKYAGLLDGISDDLKDNEKWANRVAYANSKSIKNLEDLSEGWDDLQDKLSSIDYSKQIQGVEELDSKLSKIFNIPENTLSSQFLTDAKNLDLLNLALSGNEEAWEKFSNNIYMELAGLGDKSSEVINKLTAFTDSLAIGEELDGETEDMLYNYIQQLIDMGANADSVNNTLAGFGLTVAFTDEMLKDGVISAEEYGKKIGFIGSQMDTYYKSALKEKETEKEIREIKYLDEELERYYKINKQLEKNAQVQERLSILKEKSYGAKKVKIIEEETKALEQQLKLQNDYINEAQRNLSTDMGALSAFGAQFDSQGVLLNYESMMAAQVAEYNAAVAAYNNSAQDDYASSLLEAAEARYDLFLDTLGKYDESVAEVDEAATEKLQLENDLIDKVLEKLQTEIEIKIEVNDMALERLEYMLEKLDDPILDAVAGMQNLGNQVTEIIDKNKDIQEGINKIMADSLTRSLTADEIDQLKEYRSELYANNKTLAEVETSVKDYVVGSFEALNEKLEETADDLDLINSKLDTYVNIVDIVGEKTLGLNSKLIVDLAKSKVETSKATLEATQEKLAVNRAALADAEAILAAAATEDEKRVAQELVDSIKEQVETLEEEVSSSWKEALQAAADAFQKAVERITKDLSDKLAGAFGSLEDVSAYYDKQSKVNELYLKDYEKIYELNKLNRKLAQDIDKIDNTKAKQELAKLQAEINSMMEDEVNVSKQDIEYAQKKYDLKLAEIALEEAQNAKSQVRMTRDNEGNWSYTYVADEEKTENAEQDYEDKLFAFQDYATGALSQLESSYIELNKQMAEELSQIDQTTEDGMKKAEEIRNYYTKLIYANIDEHQKLLNANALANQEYNAGLASSFNDTLFNKMYPDYVSFDEVKAGVDQSITQSLEDLTNAYGLWELDVNDIFKLAGTTIDDFGTKTMPDLYKNVSKETEKIVKNVDKTKTDMTNDFKEIITFLGTWYDDYKKPIDDTTLENEELAFSIETLIQDYINLDKQEDITINVTSPEVAALDATLSGIYNKILDINKMEIKPGADYTSLEIDRNEISKVHSVGGRTYYETIGGQIYSGKDLGDESLQVGQSVTPGKTEGMGKTQFEQLQKANNLQNEKAELEIISDSFYARSSHVDDQPVPIQLNTDGFHPDILNYSKARWIDGQLYLWIKDVENRGNVKTTLENSSIYENGLYIPLTAIGYRGKEKNGKSILEYFDTGGYTGDWGNEGRLAMLHQKEIVLNASDTENFLRVVEIVREIAGIIDLNVQSASRGLAGVKATNVLDHSQTIEQNVQITAEFPNVNNHYEIEEAFNNLVNTATQYVMRK